MKVLLAAAILIHLQYPPLCCSGDAETGDCRPVPCDSIVETKDGYEWRGVHFTPDQTHPSFDKNCHVCVKVLTDAQGNQQTFPHCVFVQPTS